MVRSYQCKCPEGNHFLTKINEKNRMELKVYRCHSLQFIMHRGMQRKKKEYFLNAHLSHYPAIDL